MAVPHPSRKHYAFSLTTISEVFFDESLLGRSDWLRPTTSAPIGSEVGTLSPHLHTWHPKTPSPSLLVPPNFWPNLLVLGIGRLRNGTLPNLVKT
jgi:hypothetical protein